MVTFNGRGGDLGLLTIPVPKTGPLNPFKDTPR